MEILSQVQDLLNRLSSNPADVDIGEIRAVLGNALLVAREGLQRSQSAARLPEALEKNQLLVEKVSSLQSLVSDLKPSLENSISQLTALKPVAERLRSQALGRLSLVQSWPAARKDSLRRRIEDAQPAELVSLVEDVNNQFRDEWLTGKNQIIDTVDFVDVREFKSC